MKRFFRIALLYLHDRTFLAWMTAGIAFAILVSLGTAQLLNDRNSARTRADNRDKLLTHIDQQLDAQDKSIKADHARIQKEQEKLYECLVSLFADGNTRVDKSQITDCTKPTQTSMDTMSSAPSSGASQPESNSSSSSSSKNTPTPPKPQPDNSQHKMSMLRFIPGVNDPIIGCLKGRCL